MRNGFTSQLNQTYFGSEGCKSEQKLQQYDV